MSWHWALAAKDQLCLRRITLEKDFQVSNKVFLYLSDTSVEPSAVEPWIQGFLWDFTSAKLSGGQYYLRF